jgi:hypothetical protein
MVVSLLVVFFMTGLGVAYLREGPAAFLDHRQVNGRYGTVIWQDWVCLGVIDSWAPFLMQFHDSGPDEPSPRWPFVALDEHRSNGAKL